LCDEQADGDERRHVAEPARSAEDDEDGQRSEHEKEA
jgi:hypothetical protein